MNQYIIGAAFNLPSPAFAQTFTIDLSTVAVPSATATPSNTPSNTASISVGWTSASATVSVSGTSTTTASVTYTPTATLSLGAQPSVSGTSAPTPSLSSSASLTSSVRPSPTQTPSVSASPGVASAVRVTIGAGQCLTLYEVIAIAPNGQILTAGATATATSVLNNDVDNFGPYNAIDLSMIDPTATGVTLTAAGANSKPFASGCGITDSLTITFAPQFAGSTVDKVYIVNDASSTLTANRVVVGAAQVQLLNSAGQPYASQPLTSAAVQTFSFYTGPKQVPWIPSAAISSSDAILSNLVRYVRIVGPNPATGECPLLLFVWLCSVFDAPAMYSVVAAFDFKLMYPSPLTYILMCCRRRGAAPARGVGNRQQWADRVSGQEHHPGQLQLLLRHVHRPRALPGLQLDVRQLRERHH